MTLNVLNALQADKNVTQRNLSSKLGIALRLINAYLKRCVDKGLVKISQIPANRYAYYLTPRGFSEKTKLTAQYIQSSFSFYRRAKKDISGLIENCIKEKKYRIVLCLQGGFTLSVVAFAYLTEILRIWNENKR